MSGKPMLCPMTANNPSPDVDIYCAGESCAWCVAYGDGGRGCCAVVASACSGYLPRPVLPADGEEA